LFGSIQDDEDDKEFFKVVSFKIVPMILASLMASLSIGMPSRIRQCQVLVLQAFVPFQIRQSKSRIKKATIECITYLKVQPMMSQPPMLSEDIRKKEMGVLLGIP